MTRKERLMNTMQGKAVDRPAVSFYEINGMEDTQDQDPFNIYSDPSWKPLIELARDKTDRMVLTTIPFVSEETDHIKKESYYENGSLFTRTTIQAGSRNLTTLQRRDPDINTVWTIEHLLKDLDDFRAWLELPEPESIGEIDISQAPRTEEALGDSGILLINTPDPLCMVAPLFSMEEYTIIALTEQELFHQALEKKAQTLYKEVEAISERLPGRSWRIYGPEYASPPYLPPYLFEEYVTKYVKPMVDIIHEHGGYARIHSHGNLKDILDSIVATGCMGLDPIEPTPQGDVELAYVRERYGDQLVLFGNLEIADIENLSTTQFEKKVDQALAEGTRGQGRGFVLMPSACPYGRKLSPQTMKNYELIIQKIENV